LSLRTSAIERLSLGRQALCRRKLRRDLRPLGFAVLALVVRPPAQVPGYMGLPIERVAALLRQGEISWVIRVCCRRYVSG